MIERPVCFGANNGLIGTICLPESGTEAGHDGSTGFILFNAGVVHRVGPHRINVRLARGLARRGIPSIRFDLAGLGDSARPDGKLSFEKQAVVDVRAAMDALAGMSPARRFALFGFCSGAHHGYATALADERVSGLLIYDAFVYPTLRLRLNRYRMRIRQHGLFTAVTSWATRELLSLARRIRSFASQDRHSIRPSDVAYVAALPHKAHFAAGLRNILDRGAKVSVIYAGGGFEHCNYAGQFRDAFGRFGIADRVDADFLPDMDHVATSMSAQAELIRKVEDWAATLARMPPAKP